KELLATNISKAKDLEYEDEIKEEIELGQNLFVGIYISSSMTIKLICPNSNPTILEYPVERFADWFKCVLIDLLFHSNFKKFDPTILKTSHTISKDAIAYNF